ncbi:Thioesterase/thiol ester dehydrase-isomerase [Amniculicola lignicola CBS 123094]|uniref:Thioesterase/thiol ester dehydrase-isomerase n=1 Tax=Amniculicola lignicola CBS 123094 TaxID=1392246 RepID=A0A6A5W047_9PLEO|nr:Thioesterase/thiol ester dehydrase-isomerase [Amniculicola lignicola CBS 123094]
MGSRAKRYAAMISHSGDLTPFEKVQKWFEAVGMEEYGGHDALLQSLMTLESATSEPTPKHPHHSTTVFSLTIPRTFCNMSGNLHGGAVALIFDICTSTAITACSKEGFWDTGHVSRTLNCTYLRPAAEGTKVFVESEVVHLGRRMGLTRGVMKTENGKICYTCEHGKAAVGASSL